MDNINRAREKCLQYCMTNEYCDDCELSDRKQKFQSCNFETLPSEEIKDCYNQIFGNNMYEQFIHNKL